MAPQRQIVNPYAKKPKKKPPPPPQQQRHPNASYAPWFNLPPEPEDTAAPAPVAAPVVAAAAAAAARPAMPAPPPVARLAAAAAASLEENAKPAAKPSPKEKANSETIPPITLALRELVKGPNFPKIDKNGKVSLKRGNEVIKRFSKDTDVRQHINLHYPDQPLVSLGSAKTRALRCKP